MTPIYVEPSSGIAFRDCEVCGLPCETVERLPGGQNFVCSHRPNPWRGIAGHRRHALCCATAIREGR